MRNEESKEERGEGEVKDARDVGMPDQLPSSNGFLYGGKEWE